MAKYLTPEFYAGLQAGKRWLREVKSIEALFRAALEAEDAVTNVERVLDEKRAELAALNKTVAEAEGRVQGALDDANKRLAEIAAHATAEKQKFDQQVADARVKADKARQQADLVVQECQLREAEALAGAKAADDQRQEAEKGLASLRKLVGA
jgi:dynactin complex subunit